MKLPNELDLGERTITLHLEACLGNELQLDRHLLMIPLGEQVPKSTR